MVDMVTVFVNKYSANSVYSEHFFHRRDWSA